MKNAGELLRPNMFSRVAIEADGFGRVVNVILHRFRL